MISATTAFDKAIEENAVALDGDNEVVQPIRAALRDNEPIPIPELLPVPPLRSELIPLPLRTWITDISERRGCPIEYPAVAAIVALGAMIGTKVGVKPKKLDSWFLFPNMWALGIGPSGSQKTDGMSDGLRFLEEIEKEEADLYEKRRPTLEAEAIDRKIELEAIETQLKAIHSGKPQKDGAIVDREVLKARIVALKSIRPETARRLMVNDSTVEKVGILLNTNPNGITNNQDEISPFLEALESKDRQADLKFYLKAANGTGTELVDRVSRESLLIRNLCLSMIGGTQPARISALAERSAEKDGDNGLLPRFTLSVYPDMTAAYRYVDSAPQGVDEARRIYKDLYSLNTLHGSYGVLAEEDGGLAYLNFDDPAQAFFERWLTNMENEIRANGTNGTDIPSSHLQKLKNTMPKLALIFQLVDVVTSRTHASGIALENAQLAAEWIEFLKHHARRLYAPSTRPEFRRASLILHKLKTGELPPLITARLVYRKHWRGLSEPKDVFEALDVLVDHNWLSSSVRETGRKPITEYCFKNTDV